MMAPILLLLAVQAAGSTTAPPPPPIYLPSHVYPLTKAKEPFRSAVFDVEVRAGGKLLWSGPMRVSTRADASLDRRQSDAVAEQCATDDTSIGSGDRESLSINVSLRRSDAPFVSVRASWERRPEGDDCRVTGSTRAVSFTDTVPLHPGKVTTIEGDGGLSVTLRQR